MNQPKQIKDGALMLFIFTIILASFLFLPIISIFLLPIPFVLFTKKYGLKSGFVMLALALLISLLIMTIIAIPLVLMMGLGGIMIGNAMYKGVTPYDTLARGIFGFIIGILFTFGFTQLFLDVNLVNQFETVVEDSVETSTAFIEEMGLAEQSEQIQEVAETQIQMMKELLPSFLVAAAAILALVVQWISYKIINRKDKQKLRFPPIRDIRFPSSIIWVYFLAFVVSLFNQDPGTTLYVGLQNLFFIVGMLLAIQGISFIFFYAHAKKMSKAIPVLIVIFTFIFPQFLLYFIRILGIIDVGFNLRDRLQKK
ncbi:YybS family protein [Oceanobacillus kimchii]|uniref:DUF2232 domain-containing protein n=1 Tax=Oceanobacillus kimchii TaxID=746691 RepID=A0ABQ5TN03_9BACI|nr:YybS family protein [Oceanobacillus kimchii]GLO68199.1 hypothetical protein MACH08_39830 [Oceanobacillus kimchii]